MTKIRDTLMVKILSFTLILFVLNLSIDSPDLYLENIDEDLTYNEFESIFEFVVEDCLEYGDVIPESDDNDDDSKFKVKKIDVLSISFKFEIYSHFLLNIDGNKKPHYITPLYHQGMTQPQSPPPWI